MFKQCWLSGLKILRSEQSLSPQKESNCLMDLEEGIRRACGSCCTERKCGQDKLVYQ